MTPSTSSATQKADVTTRPVSAHSGGKRLKNRIVLPVVALVAVAGIAILGYKIYPLASQPSEASQQAPVVAAESPAAPASTEAISPTQRLARIAHRARAAARHPPETLASTYELTVGSIACQDCKITTP